MAKLFGIEKPKPDVNAQRAQRRQESLIDKQTAEEAKELGARKRLQNARRAGGSNLFANTGAAGVKETFG